MSCTCYPIVAQRSHTVSETFLTIGSVYGVTFVHAKVLFKPIRAYRTNTTGFNQDNAFELSSENVGHYDRCPL